MANRQPSKTTFQPEKVIRPIYTGGSVALSNGAQILATTLEGDAILTDPSNGKHLAKIDGVCSLDRRFQTFLTGSLGWRVDFDLDT